jgi:hypothetical protein
MNVGLSIMTAMLAVLTGGAPRGAATPHSTTTHATARHSTPTRTTARQTPHSVPRATSATVHRTPTPASVPRDAHGAIKRDPKATTAFKRQTGYPKGRPGYVIDHKVPLKRGGADRPSNMQWQSKAAAKAKDKRE